LYMSSSSIPLECHRSFRCRFLQRVVHPWPIDRKISPQTTPIVVAAARRWRSHELLPNDFNNPSMLRLMIT
jgi:hypothetical protein